MDFTLNEQQLAFQQVAENFAKEELAPMAASWDKEEVFPVDVLRKAASLGFAGLYASDAIGGSELSRLDASIIFIALSKGCISTSAYLSIHNMVTAIIDRYGGDALRKNWGSKLTSMEVLSSYCLTEPSAGSDAASLKTTATKKNNHYVLNGSKAFISGGGVSDVYVVMARTGEAGYKGISCFLVEKGTEGLSFGKKEEKLGWHSQPTSMVFFENCIVPANNLIGELGEGFSIALNALNGGRINIASCSLGGALQSLALCKQYMGERSQFSKKLSEFQALRFRFATMLTDFEAAKGLVFRAAEALDTKHKDTPMYCAMAKRFATDVGFKIADKVLQMHGGYGYLCDYPIERIFRDLRVHQILEGSNEIMQEIIAKHALGEKYDLTN